MRAPLLASCAAACLVTSAIAQSDDRYSFDIDKFEKKPFELSGFAELRPESFRLSRRG